VAIRRLIHRYRSQLLVAHRGALTERRADNPRKPGPIRVARPVTPLQELAARAAAPEARRVLRVGRLEEALALKPALERAETTSAQVALLPASFHRVKASSAMSVLAKAAAPP